MSSTTALDARWGAVMAGFSRGWIETRQSFTQTAAIITHWFAPVMYVVVLIAVRKFTVPGTQFSVSMTMVPGFLAMSIIFGGLSGPAGGITADREDGTLLRAKATPHGMLGYLVGKIVMCALTTLFTLVVVLVPGIVIAGDLSLDARTWLLLALVFVGGMVATVPIGVALGSVLKSSLQALLVPFVSVVMVFISGIFFPMTLLPAWLQSVAQALPVYWIGLGTRSAMLPPEMVAAEIGDSWRTLEMLAVLGAWAVIGLVLAPIMLRRMARHQSGSAMARVRDRYMSKGY